MHIRRAALMALACASTLFVSACASIQGYARNPEDTQKATTAMSAYFDGTEQVRTYDSATDDTVRTRARDVIVAGRMRGYDLAFSDFERQLYGYSNSLSVGTDLLGLTLAGLTATTGGAATKAALGAASIGVAGANTAIDKDLYFQKTIPALITQMQANRSKQKLVILKNLQQPDSKYSLIEAYGDLDAYRDAGSIPSAISSITQAASDSKQAADNAIVFTRTALDISAFPDRVKLETQFRGFSDAQVLKLAALMEPNLAGRPADKQQVIRREDPAGARLTGDATKARNTMRVWLAEDEMTAANLQQWWDAMSAAAK
jgi:hypothetical protein